MLGSRNGQVRESSKWKVELEFEMEFSYDTMKVSYEGGILLSTVQKDELREMGYPCLRT